MKQSQSENEEDQQNNSFNPSEGILLIETASLESPIIFSFQGPFALSWVNHSKNQSDQQAKIAETLTVTGALPLRAE